MKSENKVKLGLRSAIFMMNEFPESSSNDFQKGIIDALEWVLDIPIEESILGIHPRFAVTHKPRGDES